MSRRKILLGNWKMNNTISQAREFCASLDQACILSDRKNIVLGVFPSYIAINTVRINAPMNLIVGSQDVHYKECGAYTGSVSIPMLKELGVKWSLVGHSERRKYEHDTNEICNLKLKALFNNFITPVYCVGETLDEYESGATKAIVHEQLVEGLNGIKSEDIEKLVIAYEPVWSIGTGKNASVEIADDVCSYIRSVIEELYGKEVSEKVSILYGGSVKPENIHSYMTTKSIDGALVGGASLKAESFMELVENF